MDKKTVKEIALENGFKLKEQPDGSLELNPYVYVFADKLVKHQQAKVEELQEEFAEDERFLKEQIKDKDLKISNLEYLQGMDKELIQSLQSKSEKLQKRVDKALELMQKPVIVGEPVIHVCTRFKEIEQALKGEGNEQ